jgi:hypothetical protein
LAGSTPAEAVENFLHPLRKCLACITNAHINVSPRGYESLSEDDDPHAATLNDGRLTKLVSDPPLGLLLAIQYRIVEAEGERGPWKTTGVQYEYIVKRWNDHREVLTYHWHPNGRGPMKDPHVHVGSAMLVSGATLDSKAHVSTGRVSVEDIIRLAIDELHVEPRRAEWRKVTEQTRGAYAKYRSWA